MTNPLTLDDVAADLLLWKAFPADIDRAKALCRAAADFLKMAREVVKDHSECDCYWCEGLAKVDKAERGE